MPNVTVNIPPANVAVLVEGLRGLYADLPEGEESALEEGVARAMADRLGVIVYEAEVAKREKTARKAQDKAIAGIKRVK